MRICMYLRMCMDLERDHVRENVSGFGLEIISFFIRVHPRTQAVPSYLGY